MFKKPKRTGTTKFKSTKHEKKTAEDFGGKLVPGSGAGVIKGDVHTKELYLECKTTSKTQYTLTATTLEVLTRNADLEDKIPVLVLQLADETKGQNREWVILPSPEFQELYERSKDAE